MRGMFWKTLLFLDPSFKAIAGCNSLRIMISFTSIQFYSNAPLQSCLQETTMWQQKKNVYSYWTPTVSRLHKSIFSLEGGKMDNSNISPHTQILLKIPAKTKRLLGVAGQSRERLLFNSSISKWVKNTLWNGKVGRVTFISLCLMSCC